MAVEWKFPACDDVVMNLLEDELDTSLVWVGSWEPPQEVVDPVSFTHLTLPTNREV